jgi:hypothetical protein
MPGKSVPGKTNLISKNSAQPAGLPVRTDVRSGNCWDEYRACLWHRPPGLFPLNECSSDYDQCVANNPPGGHGH